MNDLRHEMDESVVLTEHFILKHNRALKELALLQDKIRNEELNSFGKRRQALENEYQQTLLQIQELKQTYENVEKLSEINKNEMNQMNDLYKKHEDELHDLILNNIRLQNNIRTIEEQILFKKATYETEKAELSKKFISHSKISNYLSFLLVNEQLKQKQFYTDELGKAIEDIKHDFQILLKNNKTLLENSYAERIEQTKTQILAIEAAKQQEQPSSPRVSIDTLRNEVKQTEQVHQDLENEYRTLIEHYLSKQKDKNQIDEERLRLDNEYSRLVVEINHVTQAIESGKQYWFSVNFELETYRRLLDLETSKVTTPNPIITSKMINEYANNNIAPVSNGKEKQNGITAEEQQVLTTKKTDLQRSISKTGEIKTRLKRNYFDEGSILICNVILGQFDIDQVQAGFISINNAATNCADQSLKGWTLVHTINKEPQNVYQFPDGYVLRARTRVRVYSNKVENMGKNNANNSRLFAASIPVWTSSNKGDDVKILLIDDKGVTRAQYSETWQ